LKERSRCFRLRIVFTIEDNFTASNMHVFSTIHV
jgi:hypothetical protein